MIISSNIFGAAIKGIYPKQKKGPSGEVAGINKNSTVSNILDRAKYEMSRYKGIRPLVEKLIKTLNNSQP